ncbi:DUF4169 domain-containing protein [Asaia sp. W19]|uniref:DUF4169 family protein n=1 Tax=unclassified Asaia TaxID=2685023 RepID=UPI000F8E16A8|nr:DUF4169 family protein [Asaia sp. W19]RUT26653.1 DUF4169 domain-containing protein [Asaia sp. W19]
MAEIINLRRVRKRVAREKDAALAEENRILHGRTRAERLKTELERGIRARELDGARLEDAAFAVPAGANNEGSMKNDGDDRNDP